MVDKYLIGIMAIAFAVGVGATVGIFAATGGAPLGSISLVEKQPVPVNVLSDQVGNLTEKVAMFEQQLDGIDIIQSDIGEIQSDIQVNLDEFDDDITVIGAQVKRLSDQLDDLKSKLDKLTIGATVLSGQLNKSEFKAGDVLTLTGTGLPNKPVKVTLLGIDRFVLSEGSATTDSNGSYTFTMQLSKSYAPGEYTIKLVQEGKVVERSFDIVGTETQSVQPPATQPPTAQGDLALSVDRNQYARGEKVLLSGKTDHDVWIDIDIFDSNKVQVVRTSTKSDANGNYRYEYTIPSNAALGNYEVNVITGTKQESVKFSVVSSTSQTPSTSGSLTITTDKSDYARGDLVKITGKAPAKSKVTILVEPPSGDTLLLTVTASDSGTYQTLFTIKADAVKGTWNLTAKQDTDIATATMRVV
jgi:5-hydroxyisourate hydrolase-like protein (transthyretin family)